MKRSIKTRMNDSHIRRSDWASLDLNKPIFIDIETSDGILYYQNGRVIKHETEHNP